MSDDVRRDRILLDGKEGSTGVQMARIVARAWDDQKVLLILLDGWEGARRSDDVRRVRLLLDG